MKAIVKYAPGSEGFGLREVEKPVPAADEVLLEVYAVGICGTDIHIIRDEYPHSTPVTLGHEYVGTVVGMGEAAEGFEMGDTVVSLACAYTCETCRHCKDEIKMMCPERRSIGSWRNGAMCRYIVVPARSCFKAGGAPSVEMAAYEPAACCVRSVAEIARITENDTVLVSGAGFMGQITLQVCKYLGAKVVMAGLPRDAKRLETALAMGADAIADSAEGIQAALDRLGLEGFTAAFECAAAPASLANCIRFADKHARVVQVGLYGKAVPVDLDAALYKELRLLTSFGSNPSSWRRTLQIVRDGGIDFTPYLERVLPFSRWQQAFEDVLSGEYYKVLMRIDE